MPASFAELTSLYSNVNKAPSPLSPDVELTPGASVYEKLSKLHLSRKTSKLAPDPCELAVIVSPKEQTTVAVCLVIVDKLHHEAIWKAWEDNVDGNTSRFKVKIIIHAKHPERIESQWVKQRLVPLTYKPEWNSPEVIRAMLSTMNEGLRDPHVGRFVFGTESCIPLYPLGDIAEKLFEEDLSWLNAFNKGKNNWEVESCFRSVASSVVPPNLVWKSIPGWIMLNRRHAAEISLLATKSCSHSPMGDGVGGKGDTKGCLGNSSAADLVRAWGPGGQYREGYEGVWAPEEVFFPTMLCILGYLSPSGKDQVKRCSVNYARWKKLGDANPISFASLTPSLLAEMRSEGALFGRKFDTDAINLSKWASLILPRPKMLPRSGSERENDEKKDEEEGAKRKRDPEEDESAISEKRVKKEKAA